MKIRYTLTALAMGLAMAASVGAVIDTDTTTARTVVRDMNAEQMMPFASLVNELSQRRRRVIYIDNPVSLFDGAMTGLVHLGAGSLSFRRRDLVTRDIAPVVAARLYDSRDAGPGEFGRGGWRLSLSVSLTVSGDRAWLSTAEGRVLALRIHGDRFEMLPAGPSPIRAITRRADHIEVVEYNGRRWQLHAGQTTGRYLLHKQVDAFGNTVRYRWDEDDRLQSVESAHRRLQILRNPDGTIARLRDDSGREVVYGYRVDGYLEAVTDPAGNVWRYDYEQNGRLRQASGPDGAIDLVVSYGLDGRVRTIARHGATRSFQYQSGDAALNVAAITEVRGPGPTLRRYGHNADGVTVMVDDGAGSISRVVLDERNRPGALLAGDRQQFAFDYDADDRLRRLHRDDGSGHGSLEYNYFDDGGLRRIRAATGATLVEVIREADGELAIRRGDDEFRLLLDASGLIERVWFADDHALSFVSDAYGRFASVLDSNARSVRFSYDAAGRMTEVKFPGGETHSYAYDPLGLRTRTAVSTGAGASYDYAADGRIEHYALTTTTGHTTRTRHRLDEHGRLIGIDNADVSFDIAYEPGDRPQYIETDQGRLSFAYDGSGRFAAVSDGNNTWRYRYAPGEAGLVPRAERRLFPGPRDDSREVTAAAEIYDVLYRRRHGAYLGLLHLDAAAAAFVLSNEYGVPLPGEREKQILDAIGLLDASGDSVDGRIAFNAPSNLFFIPPEYWSLNCIICLGQNPHAISPAGRAADAWPTLSVLSNSLERVCHLSPDDPPTPNCSLNISGLPGYICQGNRATIGATLTPNHLNDLTINWSSNNYLTLVPAGARGPQVDVLASGPAGSGVGSVAASFAGSGVSCADAATVPVIANKLSSYSAVVDLNQCPERQQDTGRSYDVDGCSIPPLISWLAFSGDVQDPIGGDYHAPGFPTRFGSADGSVPYGSQPQNLPCNHHDVCYQSCGRNRLGCDNDFLDDMGRICDLSYPDDCPFGFLSPSCAFFEIEKIECGLGRTAMFQAIRLTGAPAYRQRQVQYCQCCPPD